MNDDEISQEIKDNIKTAFNIQKGENAMKEKYLKPYAEIEAFRFEDVISTSDGSDIRDDDNPVEWPWS